MNFKKLYYRALYHITKKEKLKKYYKETWGKNNKLIIIDENGNRKEYSQYDQKKFKWLDIHWFGDNNTITIKLPVVYLRKLSIFLYSNNNNVSIDKCLRGSFTFFLHNGDNNVTLGEGVSARSLTVTLNSGDVTIGNNCMISDFINILTDGHSILDAKTKDVLNNTRADIKIGNHVWIGFGATILKNAKIPNDSIVANSAVVTKPYDEENIVLAGNPAKIVKRGVSWNHTAPIKYDKETADLSF